MTPAETTGTVRGRRNRSSGTTEALSRHNAEQILRTVLASGPLPRVRIAELTGLSMPAVTRLSARLVGSGILVETPRHEETKRIGRPQIPLDFDTTNRAILAVHFGVDELRVGAVNLRGTVLGERRVAYIRNDPQSVVDLAATTAKELLKNVAPRRLVLGCGASMGGWVDPGIGAIVRYPALGWHEVPLAEMLEEALDLPVSLDNMVRAIARAEALYGVTQEIQNYVEFYIGNVVGAAIVVDQIVRPGARSAAGTLPADLDKLSDLHIIESAVRHQEVIGRGTILGAIAAAVSHPRLARLFAERSVSIASAIAPIFDLLDPDLLVVAGSPALAEAYFPIILEHLAGTSAFGEGAAARTVRSALGHDDLTLASASIRLDEVLNRALEYAPTASEVVPARGEESMRQS